MPMSPASTSPCLPTTAPRSNSAAPLRWMTGLPWRMPRWRAPCRSSTSRPRQRPQRQGRASWRRRCRIASEVMPSRWQRQSTAAAWPALPRSRSISPPIRAMPWCWLRARVFSASSASRGARAGKPSCWRCWSPLPAPMARTGGSPAPTPSPRSRPATSTALYPPSSARSRSIRAMPTAPTSEPTSTTKAASGRRASPISRSGGGTTRRRACCTAI